MTAEHDASGPKPRRRVAAKASGRLDAKRTKLTLYLDADLAKRFATHAVQMDMDKSELLAELVRSGCKRFVVSDRERPGASAEPDAA